ncbi:nucleotidyltransferase family protein [Bacillus tianshenii]|uniref:nucleotidyltransferase family protein n=1 Tax=Sutcliffiella tianshenii TaxID=1463404 RepID=UPI001CD750CE|nr:nucleotidyltransferase family protein [Bacillus tianshenii]MCA1319365.1 nucleotidyltransferase family protein [Bacillus tianshenii]
MMEILKTARTLELPDWWVCAGFVRSKIWDTQHGFNERTELPDIDVIYFDPHLDSEEVEKELEAKLASIQPSVPWSVKNQVRMHRINNLEPYSSSIDAMSKFPETATALGVKLDEYDSVILAAPCGVEDVLQLKLRATEYFTKTEERKKIFEDRILKKNWQSIWTNIEIKHV